MKEAFLSKSLPVVDEPSNYSVNTVKRKTDLYFHFAYPLVPELLMAPHLSFVILALIVFLSIMGDASPLPYSNSISYQVLVVFLFVCYF